MFVWLALLAVPSALAEEVRFDGEPIEVRLEPGKLTEVVFQRRVEDMALGGQLHVRRANPFTLWVRPAKAVVDTNAFVALEGGYSVGLEFRLAEEGHPAARSIEVVLDTELRPHYGAARSMLGGGDRALGPSREPTTLLRAMYLRQSIPGYSILDDGRVLGESPEVRISLVQTWLGVAWKGEILEVENLTEDPIPLNPMDFYVANEDGGELLPSHFYAYGDELAPRPRTESEEVRGEYRTYVILVRRVAAKGTMERSVPRKRTGAKQ